MSINNIIMRTLRDICGAANMPMTWDDFRGGDIVAAACTHIGATVQPRLLEGVWLAAPDIEGNDDPVHGIRIEDGSIRVPRGPGPGMFPDRPIFGKPVLSSG